jgi:shikimate kinase
MGSGKSTIGPVLASKMDRPFYDLDDLIEEEQERTISEIFESQGEEHFRKLESAALIQNQPSEPCVMALGGGTFVSDDSINGQTFRWKLKASLLNKSALRYKAI